MPFRVVSAGAEPPRAMTAGAAGFDLAAAESTVIEPGRVVSVGTGLAVAIPEGFEGQVRPRSGLALRHAIGVLNAPGTIDSDYRGEIRVLLINLGGVPFTVCPGDRIAQLVLQRVVCARFVAVSSLDDTERGTGGFGHTGT